MVNNSIQHVLKGIFFFFIINTVRFQERNRITASVHLLSVRTDCFHFTLELNTASKHTCMVCTSSTNSSNN